jgi:hypothetical protein
MLVVWRFAHVLHGMRNKLADKRFLLRESCFPVCFLVRVCLGESFGLTVTLRLLLLAPWVP